MDKKELAGEKTKKVPHLKEGTPLTLISVDDATQHFTETARLFHGSYLSQGTGRKELTAGQVLMPPSNPDHPFLAAM